MNIHIFLVFLASFTGSLGVTPNINIERHFKHLSEKRHPNYQAGKAWLQAREYISDKMYEYGIKNVKRQVFNTTISGKEVEGVNIIGITEGHDPDGPIMLVGADYSTAQIGNHLKNNTGGVACLLETVHLFMHNVLWESYYQNFTVIFVAFDLNTREYYGSEMGQPGSHYFVSQWLIPYLTDDKKHREFRGALILDSVTTYNTQNKSQLLRQGFDEAMPDAVADIRKNGKKGDFLGLLYTTVQENNPILSTYYDNYYKERIFLPFRLLKMELHVSSSTLTSAQVLNLINHQSHYYFWTANYYGAPLAAFLLYDTDGDRIDPAPGTCSFGKCDVDKFLTTERINFMTQTTKTLVRTLLDLQTTYAEYPSSSNLPSVSVVLMVFSALLSSLILKD